MRSRRIAVTVPEPVLDALYAEGSRTYETVGQVAARVLRQALPEYVGDALRRDLASTVRGRVIDVRSTPADDPYDAQRPAELAAGRASEQSLNATTIVPGRGSRRAGGDNGDPAT